MSDETPRNPLNYAKSDAAAGRRRLLRWLGLLIAAKLVLVAANVGMAFSTVPDVLRVMGVGAQVALTALFLVLVFRLAAK